MNLKIKGMKEYLKLFRCLQLASYNQMQFSVIPRAPLFEGGLTPLQGMPSEYSKPDRQGMLEYKIPFLITEDLKPIFFDGNFYKHRIIEL